MNNPPDLIESLTDGRRADLRACGWTDAVAYIGSLERQVAELRAAEPAGEPGDA